ncbi:helix-turn-helix domain-containing protein [Flavobacterium sp. DGU11]|uniref:Helix-turn-helix domain-containing protein n=1 Tax=Flavobacterium arundinis TaxID=3139143 RepID=A0ABU9HV38_9FLAO
MYTGNIPVCGMEMFDEGPDHFWIGELKAVSALYPMLEIPHKNSFYSLVFVIAGSGELTVDASGLILENSKAYIIKPGCITTLISDDRTSGKMICFAEDFFSLRYNSNVLSQFSFFEREAKRSLSFTGPQQQKVESLLSLLQEEYKNQGKASAKVLRSYLNILLFELERSYSPMLVLHSVTHSQEKIQEFEKLVEANYVMWKRPSIYAEQLNVSTNYLNKLCKKETGLTAGDLIRRHILLEAQRLLHYTRLTIGEISAKLGFENVSYFVTLFKKHMLHTPEEFRKSQNI